MTQAATTSGDKEAAPAPTFDAIPLGADLRKAVDALGYVHPTPVQLAVFEPATRGKSLVVQARTGTGKTAAFGLPIIDTLVRRSVAGVQALILTPTRELALQVARELEHLAQFRGTRIVPIYGGAPMGRQISALAEGAQIVVGTPGRVLDHLRRGTLDPSAIRIFVLDEADEMLSMGFAKELNAIIETLPKERQGLYFSATIPPDVERLATSHLRDPEWVTLSSDQVGALEISHFVYLVREGDKRGALARILEVEDPESAIVFCNTRDETERVAEMLKSRGYDADWLNGDLEQRERERVMNATKEGKLRFLVATDVAARGIDISHLTHVVNADFPESAEQYVHRTGRTGRAGKTGTAISVVGPKDVGNLYMLRLTYKIRPIERMLPTQGEMRTRAEADIVAFLADAYAGKVPQPLHLAVARRLLTHENAELLIAGLLADHLGAQDVTQEAADARRARNPAPFITTPGAPLMVGDTQQIPALKRPDARGTRERSGGRREGRDAREGREENVRRERPPQAALRDWEPPAENDDDAPIFRDEGTKPGIGLKGPPHQRDAQADATASEPPRDLENRPAPPKERGDRGERAERGDRGRGRRGRGFAIHDAGDNADTIDIKRPPLPAYHIEDEPTIAFGGKSLRTKSEPAEESERDDAAFTNVFLNVGRRDGLRTEDVQRLLTEKAGLALADVGHIRLRERITFVGIRREHCERAIQSLIGTTVGDRTLNAEPARDR